MRVISISVLALLGSVPALAEGPTQVELEAGVQLVSLWHHTQDNVFGGIDHESDYQLVGPSLGLRLTGDTSKPWLSVSVGARGGQHSPTTPYLSGFTTLETGDGNVDIEHDHQTELNLNLFEVDAMFRFHANPGSARVGLGLGPGVRLLDLERRTHDTYFLFTSTESTDVTTSYLRAQPYLALELYGSLELSEGVHLGLVLGFDPAPQDLEFYDERASVLNPDNGVYSEAWIHALDMSFAFPRAGLRLGADL